MRELIWLGIEDDMDVPMDLLNSSANWRADEGDWQADIYLSFSGCPQMQFAGFLVTQRHNPDRLIAYCPMPPRLTAKHSRWRREVIRHLRIALRIARAPETVEDAIDAVNLGWIGANGEKVPPWIYGLCCLPLTGKWGGNFVHPRPFCPALFTHMAQQPEAVRWITKHHPKAHVRGES